MAKKSPEAKRIVNELEKEFENYKLKVLPKFQKKARGRLHKLHKSLNKLKPLKIRATFASKVEKEFKAKSAHLKNQILQARKKSTSDKLRINNLSQEIRRLKKEIPSLKKNIRAWSSAERAVARKHKQASRFVSRFQKKISKLERSKEKIVHELQKYFQ